MEHLLLVNRRPNRATRRRRAHRARRRHNRSHRRRMPAGLARYWAAKRGRRLTRVHNPRRRRRNRRRSRTMARRRRRNRVHHHRRHRVRHHRVNRRRYARRHYRRLRNPRRGRGGFGSIRGIVRSAVIPAALGAGGAVVFDVVYGYLNPYLPAQFQTGWMNVLAKGAFAVGLGMVGMKVLGRERGRVMMLGALTVTAYGALRTAVTGMGIPGLSGFGFRDYTPYPMGAYIQGPTGTPGIAGLGYVSPAAVVGPTMSPRMGAYMPMNVVPAMGDYGDGM